METGDSEAHRRTESVAGNSERLACKLLADPVDGDSDIFFFFYVGDDLQKFFSSQAATNVGLAGVRLENSGEALEHDVSGIMSMGIVDALEAVQIGHGYPNGKTVARRSTQFVRVPGVDRTPVRQTR